MMGPSAFSTFNPLVFLAFYPVWCSWFYIYNFFLKASAFYFSWKFILRFHVLVEPNKHLEPNQGQAPVTVGGYFLGLFWTLLMASRRAGVLWLASSSALLSDRRVLGSDSFSVASIAQTGVVISVFSCGILQGSPSRRWHFRILGGLGLWAGQRCTLLEWVGPPLHALSLCCWKEREHEHWAFLYLANIYCVGGSPGIGWWVPCPQETHHLRGKKIKHVNKLVPFCRMYWDYELQFVVKLNIYQLMTQHFHA